MYTRRVSSEVAPLKLLGRHTPAVIAVLDADWHRPGEAHYASTLESQQGDAGEEKERNSHH